MATREWVLWSDDIYVRTWPWRYKECAKMNFLCQGFVIVLQPANAVASLGRVTPGAASEGVTPLFFLKNLATFFCSLLSLSLSLFIAFIRVSPSRGCHPTPFYLSDLVSPLFFANLPTKKFHSGVTPWRVSPGRSPPLPPPSYATVRMYAFSYAWSQSAPWSWSAR